MDIEDSPDAPMQAPRSAARNNDGRAGCDWAGGGGVMGGQCVCSSSHPGTEHGERNRRILEVRAEGVLWRHSSFNLVEPRFFAPAAAWSPRQCAADQTAG